MAISESTKNIASSVAAAAIIAVIGWAWHAESRLGRTETEVVKCSASLEVIQSNSASIQVIQARLVYIERGIDEIKDLLKER